MERFFRSWTKAGRGTAAAVLLLLSVTAVASLWRGQETPGAEAESSSIQAETESSAPETAESAGGQTEAEQAPQENEEKEAEGTVPTIRVAIYGDDYGSLYQDSVQISSAEDFTVRWNGGEEQMAGDAVLTLTPEDARFASGSVWIQGNGCLQILSSHRECGYPEYPGDLEIILTEGK